jgi:hypothetical protein
MPQVGPGHISWTPSSATIPTAKNQLYLVLPTPSKKSIHPSIYKQHHNINTTIVISSKTTLGMTNHRSARLNARDLSSRLTRLSQSTNDLPGTSSYMPGSGESRTSSLDSFDQPKFSKSSTMSTTDSSGSDLPHLHVTHAAPCTKTSRASAEVGVGEFSKPRVNKRSRRNTTSSARSARSEGANDDFRYYGRHGNQWLFNDFSITDSIKKGWGKVFRKEDVEMDWLEKRG